MKHYNIQLIETPFEEDGATICPTYGLLVSNDYYSTRVPSISSNKVLVLELLAFCHEHLVSPIHVKDVIEDYLLST
jgi:hypothetical protein